MLDWSRDDLTRRCGVARSTIRNFEAGLRLQRVGTIQRLQQAFEVEGIEFLPETGVKLSRRSTSLP
jgi:transcriptional regulator with XRE-family HTH domain